RSDRRAVPAMGAPQGMQADTESGEIARDLQPIHDPPHDGDALTCRRDKPEGGSRADGTHENYDHLGQLRARFARNAGRRQRGNREASRCQKMTAPESLTPY